MKVLLTERQKKCYELYKSGLKQSEIALELDISQGMVCLALQKVAEAIGLINVKRYSKRTDYKVYDFPENELE